MVGSGRAVDRLLGSDAVLVVGVLDAIAGVRQTFQLTTHCPGQGLAQIAGRITDHIIGDRLTIEGNQLVAPGRVITVAICGSWCAERAVAGGVRIVVPALDIAAGIVGEGPGVAGAAYRVVLTNQLAQAIIVILDPVTALGDHGDIAQAVITVVDRVLAGVGQSGDPLAGRRVSRRTRSVGKGGGQAIRAADIADDAAGPVDH